MYKRNSPDICLHHMTNPDSLQRKLKIKRLDFKDVNLAAVTIKFAKFGFIDLGFSNTSLEESSRSLRSIKSIYCGTNSKLH